MATEAITPKTDQEVTDTITTMAENIDAVKTVLQIPADRVTQLKNDKLLVDWVTNFNKVLKADSEQGTKTKNELIWGDEGTVIESPTVTVPSTAPATLDSGIEKRMMSLIGTIKKHPKYTEAIGKLLGIIGAEKVIDFTDVKAVLRLKHSNPEGIEFSFKKMGATDVIISSYIYEEGVKIPENYDDVPWVVVAHLNHSPYVDKRLNKLHKPETRLFKMRLRSNDKLVGIESDVTRLAATVYIDEDGNELSGIAR